MTINIVINTEEEWRELFRELKARDLLDRTACFYPGTFPAGISLDITNLLDLASGPMVKPFRKKIKENLTINLCKVEGLAN